MISKIRNEKGFTLIELLVVVAIIGIGVVALGFYLAYARRAPSPVLDRPVPRPRLRPAPVPSVCLSGTSVMERSSSSPATRRPEREES